MNNNSILLIDPAFDPAMATSCTLLIKVGLDSFSYAIISNEMQQVIAVFDEQECEDGGKKFAERLRTDNYLQLPYQEVRLALPTTNSIHLPQELTTEEFMAANTSFFVAPHTGKLYQSEQPYFNFITFFTLAQDIEQAVNHFDAALCYPQNAGLLQLAEDKNDTLTIDFTVGAFSMAYTANHQLVLDQSFEIAAAEEFNYYLLLLINQLHIDTEKTTVAVTGIINEGDGNHTCLLKYFKAVVFLPVQSQFNIEVLEDMPSHYYSNLLALYTCV